MNLFRRLLASAGAAGILVGLGGATQAFATSPFAATIQLSCATVGATQNITVHTAQNVLVHIEVTINGSTANGGTTHGTGLPDASGNFKDEWTIATVPEGMATVRVWALLLDGVATGRGSFLVRPANQLCPSPVQIPFFGDFVDTTQVGGTVKKTCDTGVSGNAVFAPTIQVKVAFDSALNTTIVLPAGLSITLACNGDSKALPKLPPTSVITLHEATLPTGAAAAADTKVTVAASPAATTIHNAKAAVVVLPPTGRPASVPMMPWLAIALLGLIAAGTGLVLRRRS